MFASSCEYFAMMN